MGLEVPEGGGKAPKSNVYVGAVDSVLNESGVMQEMKKRRDRIDHKKRPK